MILGIDEAGRGPWAGPLVVGAVVLGGIEIPGLTDSKKLSKKRRETVYDSITKEAVAYASGWVSANELDDLGMSESLRLATRRAVEQIRVPYSELIIDGTVNFLSNTNKGKYAKTMTKADLLIPSVSAASIIAKVERDRYMALLDTKYPGYGFGSHAGYGVAKHREAISRLGVTPEHRLSFAPLSSFRPKPDLSEAHSASQVSTTKQIGDQAESIVADYLRAEGHAVLERNWRTRLCEIDIVSKKHDTFYFTEVKYRKSYNQGGGIAAITPKKLKQMTFAANLYAKGHRLEKCDLRLAAADVGGVPPTLQAYLELG